MDCTDKRYYGLHWSQENLKEDVIRYGWYTRRNRLTSAYQSRASFLS